MGGRAAKPIVVVDGDGAARYGHLVRMPYVVHHLGLRNDAADPDNGNLSASPGEWCLLGGRCVQTVWRRRAVEFTGEALALLAKICTEFTKACDGCSCAKRWSRFPTIGVGSTMLL